MSAKHTGLVVWDVDGTLIPADLRWLRRVVARTFDIPEETVRFPDNKIHGYTDESILIDTAIASGIDPDEAVRGVEVFRRVLVEVLEDGRRELARDQSAYAGAAEAIEALHLAGFAQTVLTGNLRVAAEIKLQVAGLDEHLDLDSGAYGSDSRDRFDLPAVVAARYQVRYGHVLDTSRTVVIGDAPNDIACARHGGFQVIAVTHRLAREELARLSPDAVVDHLGADTATVVSRLVSG